MEKQVTPATGQDVLFLPRSLCAVSFFGGLPWNDGGLSLAAATIDVPIEHRCFLWVSGCSGAEGRGKLQFLHFPPSIAGPQAPFCLGTRRGVPRLGCQAARFAVPGPFRRRIVNADTLILRYQGGWLTGRPSTFYPRAWPPMLRRHHLQYINWGRRPDGRILSHQDDSGTWDGSPRSRFLARFNATP